jgi:S-methylmethionine-dependent homocysteine/selenocysteine methylase
VTRVIDILDGPVGTELLRRGVPTPLPGWSASANLETPDVLRQIHRDYARAGARFHTTNTFRTKQRTLGDAWRSSALAAVRCARDAMPEGHVLLGSIAPLEDCYAPHLSPANDDPEGARVEHRALIEFLAEYVDVLLVETFPHALEARIATEVAAATSLPVWTALTPGPDATLMTPTALAEAARQAREVGASRVFVNCVAAELALPYVDALAALGIPFGIYANAGAPEDAMGWRALDEAPEAAAERYLEHAKRWAERGACCIGSCCGTGPQHIAALATLNR